MSKKFYGSFLTAIEADSQEELDNKMDILAQSLSEFNASLPDNIDISGFEETEEKWSEEDED